MRFTKALQTLSSLFFFFASACDDDNEPFERLSKLRTIGVEMPNPAVALSEYLRDKQQTVALKAILAIPKEQTLTSVQSYVDQDWPLPQSKVVTVDENSITYQDFGAFRIASFTATASLDFAVGLSKTEADNETSDAAGWFEKYQGVFKVRYGMQAKADSEVENIVGDFFLVQDGQPFLEWKPIGLSLEKPADTVAAAEKIELLAKVNKPEGQDEDIKVAWFVSSGKVENGKAKETKWLEAEKGEQTVIVAIYPSKSKRFTYVVKKVTIN